MAGSSGDVVRDQTMILLWRVGLVLAGVVLWSAVFLTVRANTESTVEPCLDTVVVEVSAACAAPQPSLLPAIPIATTVLVVAISGSLVVRRQRDSG